MKISTGKISLTLLGLCLLLLVSAPSHAQYQGRIDSLNRVLNIETDHEKTVNILLELAELTISDNPDQAILHANRANAIAGNISYPEGQAKALIALAAIYRQDAEYEQALSYLEQANVLLVEQGAEEEVVHNMLQMGLVHQARGDFPRAMETFLEATAAARELKSDRLEALAHVLIGSLYYSEGKVIEARDYYMMGTQKYAGFRNDRDFGAAMTNLGAIYLESGDYPRATELVNAALRVFENSGEISPLVRLNFMAGTIAYDTENYRSALAYFNTCLDLAQATSDKEYIILSYEFLGETYAELNEFENAYRYMSYYAAIKDSRRVSELEANLEAEVQSLRASDAQNEADLAQAELDKSNFLLYTSVGGLILIAIFMVFVIRQYRLKNQANKELVIAKDKAERSQQEKEKFLAYTSHEIRTPLNAVVGMIELLKKTTLSDDQERYVSTIKSSSDNILIIVNDILDLTKIDSGKIDFESIDFMLTELVDEIVYMLQVKANAKGVKLYTVYDEKLPTVVKGDPLRLSQILLNLVNNAIKFTEEGEVSVRVHCLQENQGRVRIGMTVNDTGIGIKKEKLSSVFNRFEQEDKDTTRKYGGAGLGLSITKQLVELQGGSISVRSKFGEGSTFSVRMVFDIGDEQNLMRNVNPDNLIAPENLGDFRLLLVDDNVLNRTILFDLLKGWNPNLQIEMAEDGKSAVRRVESADFDIILMDIQMPRMNGYEASKYIRERMSGAKSRIPIIAMTAHALSGIADKIQEAGMNDYVSKPIDTGALIQKFAKHLKGDSAAERPSYTKPEKSSLSRRKFKTINLEHLEKLTNHDEKKIGKYIDIFLRNLNTDLADFKQHAADQDWQQVGKVAHKMKGNSSYMGIKELEVIFASAQHLGETEVDTAELSKTLARIEVLCDEAVKELTEVKENL